MHLSYLGPILFPRSPTLHSPSSSAITMGSGSIFWIKVVGALIHIWKPEIPDGCDVSSLLTWQEIFSFHIANWAHQFSSVQSSHSVVSDSLQPHGLQHARPPCPSPTARVYPNRCPLSRCCHPTIPSSVIPVSSCPQSFSASGSFPMSQFFASGSQSIELQLQHQSFQWTLRTDLL